MKKNLTLIEFNKIYNQNFEEINDLCKFFNNLEIITKKTFEHDIKSESEIEKIIRKRRLDYNEINLFVYRILDQRNLIGCFILETLENINRIFKLKVLL